MFETLKNILNHNIFRKNHLSFNNFKENLPIILIIPTSLGGIWQLLELSKLGIPYIRFFSVAQLLPDGLVIIVIIISILVFLSNSASLYENKSFEHHSKYSLNQLFFFLIFNLIALTLISLTIYKIHGIKSELIALLLEFAFIYFVFKCLIYIIELITTITIKIRGSDPKEIDLIFKKFKEQDYTSIFTRPLTIIFICFFVFTLWYTASSFRKIAYYPDDFENLTKLETELIKNFRLCEEPKLEYFNKDYLFYKLKIDDKEKIYVIESKNLFLSPLEPVIKEKKESED
ncbi:hypothetical protein A1Z55_RS13625 [Acinetobacter baumannii]|nr:hypothetical protein [Acinetobacter baumannii]